MNDVQYCSTTKLEFHQRTTSTKLVHNSHKHRCVLIVVIVVVHVLVNVVVFRALRVGLVTVFVARGRELLLQPPHDLRHGARLLLLSVAVLLVVRRGSCLRGPRRHGRYVWRLAVPSPRRPALLPTVLLRCLVPAQILPGTVVFPELAKTIHYIS